MPDSRQETIGLDELLRLAQTYITTITADNPAPAWPQIPPSAEYQKASITSLIKHLQISRSNRSNPQV